jgi:5'-nucleotidase (lipoprotein e(P4) family)
MKKQSVPAFSIVRNHSIAIFVLLVLFVGCKTTSKVQTNNLTNTIPDREYSIQSVLWQQQSAEYKALCYQAFNIAKYRLDDYLSRAIPGDKPFAIITDIDETVLDNSPYQGYLIEKDKDYTRETWTEWGVMNKAEPVPGALEFFKYAKTKGVEIFYLSNRYTTQQQETMANLQKLGFPNVDEQHMLLRAKSGGKEPRRQLVYEISDVILLMGDNLSDFSELFDGKSTAERNTAAKSIQEQFGNRFIVLPNPMYGDWETKGIYEGKYDWTPAQKDSIRRKKLKGY